MTITLSCTAVDDLEQLLGGAGDARAVLLALSHHAELPTLRSISYDVQRGTRSVLEADPERELVTELEGEAARPIVGELAELGHYVQWSYAEAPDSVSTYGFPCHPNWDWLLDDPKLKHILAVGRVTNLAKLRGLFGDYRDFILDDSGARFVEVAMRHRLMTVFR